MEDRDLNSTSPGAARGDRRARPADLLASVDDEIASTQVRRPRAPLSHVPPSQESVDAGLRELARAGGGEPDESGFDQAPALLPEVGTEFGRFRLLTHLGDGGMGRVYRAEQAGMERVVALKVGLYRDGQRSSRMRREPIAQARVRHPNVVEVYETGMVEMSGAGSVQRVRYIAMEYVEGVSLDKHVAALRDREESLPVHRACEYARQVALGLAEAHKCGVIHRDIKPGNIMLVGGGECVKVADFGLSRIIQVGRVTGTLTYDGTLLGTLHYMAPEQLSDAHKADGRADIYSLGRTLMHLLTGEVPKSMFDLGEQASLGRGVTILIKPDEPEVKAIPPGLAQVLRKMTAYKPAERYQTAEEVAAALLPYCAAPFSRRKAVAFVAAAVALAPVGLMILSLGAVRVAEPSRAKSGHPEADGPPEVRADPAGRNSVGMILLKVPAGEFLMGSPLKEHQEKEGPQHTVRISKSFLLGIHEVTQGQYESVMGTNPSHFVSTGDGAKKVRDDDTSRLPVESVSWFDAVDFCNKLSVREGLKPYYRVIGRTLGNVDVLGGTGYRLPTEAEWEYACRAGSASQYCFGDADSWAEIVSRVGEYSWHSENSGRRPHSVGSKLPNRFGLYDMNGNVSEWVWDRYAGGFFARAPVVDPRGPDQEGKLVNRINRLGSFANDPTHQRNTARHHVAPTWRSEQIGFRVARSPE